jgi:hypothetical protein
MDQTQFQKEAEEFTKSGKKLNTETLEEIDVTVIKPEFDGKKVTFKTAVEKQTQKVTYVQSTPRLVICQNHFFMPSDPKKYIFKCKNCDYNYKAQIITHKYNPQTGEILFRETGLRAV